MNSNLSGKLIPIALCAIATVALVAAGLFIYDARHELSTPQEHNDREFVAFSSPTEADDDENPRGHENPTDDEAIPDWSEVDWEELAHQQEWEILEPRDDEAEPVLEEAGGDADQAAPAGNRQGRRRKGQLVVITNFTKAEVTVNGDRYQSYSSDGTNPGMELVANETHQVVVVFNGNQRIYDINLRPGERRLLMVELTGMGQGPQEARPEPNPRRTQERRERARRPEPEEEELDEDEGEITVYSRPRGTIYVGGSSTGEGTPGTVSVDPGRHEVQVEYDGGELSETKTVRVRGGSRIKLFFRDDD